MHDRNRVFVPRDLMTLTLIVALPIIVGLFVYAALTRGDGDDNTAAGRPTGTDAPSTADEVADTDDGTQTSVAPTDCEPVNVWASPEVLPAVESAATRASSECFVYEIVPRETATARLALRSGDLPDVWVPNSASWPQLAAEEGIPLEVGQTVASTPVMLAATTEAAGTLEQLGIGSGTTFAEVAQTYSELAATGEAPITLRVGDPRVDAATMSLLGTSGTQSDSWAEGSGEARELLILLAQTAVQSDPLSAVRSDPTTVVPATEQQLASAAAEGEELHGIPLSDGAGVVRVPFVRGADTGSAEAVAALEEQLTADEAAEDFTALGLRPGTDGRAPGAAGVPEGLSTTGPDVAPDVVVATAETWNSVAPQAKILAVIDISVSMSAEIGDTTRIDLTRTAAQTSFSVISEDTAMGLWYFATALDGATDYAEQVPLRRLSEEVSPGVTQKQLLLDTTEDLGLDTLTGDTGLYDSVWGAYEFMQSRQSPGTISTVLMLTDGVNDDSTGGLSEDQAVQLLTEARQSSDAPATVVLIGIGPDVDEGALQRLATAAGGESFILRDPRELPQVLVDVVARQAL